MTNKRDADQADAMIYALDGRFRAFLLGLLVGGILVALLGLATR